MSNTQGNPPAKPGAEAACSRIPRRFSPGLCPGIALLLALLGSIAGCGKPTAAEVPELPSQVLDFPALFAQNCAGCHGTEGKLGPAPPLNDPLFLSFIPPDAVREVIDGGRPGTLMPAFGLDQGGSLTREQIDVLAHGLATAWPPSHTQLTAPIPGYYFDNPANPSVTAGSVASGKTLFAKTCAGCHGDEGHGGKMAGAINEPALLDLLSDLALRRIIVTGRPDLGMPSFVAPSNDATAPAPLTSGQISDLVAYLASLRGPSPPLRTATSSAK